MSSSSLARMVLLSRETARDPPIKTLIMRVCVSALRLQIHRTGSTCRHEHLCYRAHRGARTKQIIEEQQSLPLGLRNINGEGAEEDLRPLCEVENVFELCRVLHLRHTPLGHWYADGLTEPMRHRNDRLVF